MHIEGNVDSEKKRLFRGGNVEEAGQLLGRGQWPKLFARGWALDELKQSTQSDDALPATV